MFINIMESTPLHAEGLQSFADFIKENQEKFDERSVELINATCRSLENGNIQDSQLYSEAVEYLLYLISTTGINFYYIGREKYINQLNKIIDDKSIASFVHITADNVGHVRNFPALTTALNLSTVPYIIYDPDYIRVVNALDHTLCLNIESIYDLMLDRNIVMTDIHHSLSYYMEKVYSKLKERGSKTFITGNSYAHFGFPEKYLAHETVNLSAPCLCIKQIHAITHHILSYYNEVDNFIFCIGLFDLYHDMLKVSHEIPRMVAESYSTFSTKNNISPYIYEKKLSHYINERFFKGFKDDVLFNEDDLEKEYITQFNNIHDATVVDSEHKHNNAAAERALCYKGLLYRENTRQENQRLLREITENFKQNGKQLTIILPPLTKSYTENLGSEMINNTLLFLNTLVSPNIRLIDFSNHPDFLWNDFRDGEHLSLGGADKMINKLRAEGIIL